MPPSRMTANPVRPARHRPGKAMAESESSSEEEEEEVEVPEKKPERRVRAPPKVASAPVAIKSEAQKKAEREAMERMAAEAGFVTESEKEEEEEGQEDESSEEESEESSEEESESEEETPRLMLRPKFIPKSQRGKSAQEKEAEEREAEEARKKEDANALVEEQIKRDLAARASGRKQWEDSEPSDAEAAAELDDTDGLNPREELAAFRLRKMKRFKRDREAMLAREREIEELERRRNLTEEERAAEDAAKVARQEEERGEKGSMGYMRRYFHKGAFYRDEAEGAGLLDRDLAGARFVDEVSREKLPEYLQRRDMSKIGRKGATRYKDLRAEDTGRWGEFERRDGRGWEGGDERFRPDARGGGTGEYGAKGANAIPLGAPTGPRRDEKRDMERSRDRSDRDRDDDRRRDREKGKEYRERGDRDRDRRREREGSRERFRRRSYSRSRSPPSHRRKRSVSPDRHDKRRRVDSR